MQRDYLDTSATISLPSYLRCLHFVGLAFLIFHFEIAYAKDVRLFESEDYNAALQGIRPGDSIEYVDPSTGKRLSIRMGVKLGSGNTTAVYEMLDYPNRVVRLPKAAGMFQGEGFSADYAALIDLFVEGQKVLPKGLGVQVYNHVPGKLAVVERVAAAPAGVFYSNSSWRTGEIYSLNDYIMEVTSAYPTIKTQVRYQMTLALYEFAARSYEFANFSDFREGQQLAYDFNEMRWKIIDNLGEHPKWNHLYELRKNFFSSAIGTINAKHRGNGVLVPISYDTEFHRWKSDRKLGEISNSIRSLTETAYIIDSIISERRVAAGLAENVPWHGSRSKGIFASLMRELSLMRRQTRGACDRLWNQFTK